MIIQFAETQDLAHIHTTPGTAQRRREHQKKIKCRDTPICGAQSTAKCSTSRENWQKGGKRGLLVYSGLTSSRLNKKDDCLVRCKGGKHSITYRPNISI